ncbi:hypothetical protein RND71_033062 [Anisodus tanguticus]|uniref:Fibronectin type III-like domain-containing protein n=1 Tax=Anisodus tanguticus TaxID=243964 RepID=A0AAE1R812_9SOLA|nr:hypothetical protein RND71_033062 [Anisodus tanguticus]
MQPSVDINPEEQVLAEDVGESTELQYQELANQHMNGGQNHFMVLGTNGPGINSNGPIKGSTSFPQVILTAAAFNRTLWHSIASAIAIEARAMYNTSQSGLNVLETQDGEEDKKHQGKMLLSMRVLKEEDDDGDGDRLMLSACCKHFTAYDLEKWGDVTRYNFNAVGNVLEEDLDRALQYLFSVQFRLGLFDGDPANGLFANFGPQDVCTSESLNLALDAARQGIVLLKNDKKFLPLNKRSVSTLAIVGPMANVSSPGGTYSAGCLDVGCNSTADFQDAICIAKEADYVIVVAGLDLSQETEDHDRYSLLLPGYQTKLVTTLAAVNLLYGFGHGLSYTSFSSQLLSAPKRLSLSLAKSNLKRSILAQEHSRLGYIHVKDVPSCHLSKFFVHISVTNDGDMDGSHVLLLFSSLPQNIQGAPLKTLVGFDRVHVPARKSVQTSLLVDPCELLSFANDQGSRILALGEHTPILDDIEHVVSIEM